jgi:hypothetical protein
MFDILVCAHWQRQQEKKSPRSPPPVDRFPLGELSPKARRGNIVLEH